MNIRWLKKHKNSFLLLIAVASVGLMVIDIIFFHDLKSHLSQIVWTSGALAVTETLFIVGALIMALSLGERIEHFRSIKTWHHGIRYIRLHARQFGEQLIVSPTFTLGFWVNFVGAVGSSVILIIGLLSVAPYTSLGILTVIVIDLVATFGWRIPIEIARRRLRHAHHS